MKLGHPQTPRVQQWLADNLQKGAVVGADSKLALVASYNMRKNFLEEKGITFAIKDENLVDIVWDKDAEAHPSIPKNKVFELPLEFAGRSSSEKQTAVEDKLKSLGANALLVTTLDDICWLLNMRGSDIAFNPVFFAYLLFLRAGELRLYIDADKVLDVASSLEMSGVKICPYTQIAEDLRSLPQLEGRTVAYDENACNAMLF